MQNFYIPTNAGGADGGTSDEESTAKRRGLAVIPKPEARFNRYVCACGYKWREPVYEGGKYKRKAMLRDCVDCRRRHLCHTGE